jgi:hypothetical protein
MRVYNFRRIPSHSLGFAAHLAHSMRGSRQSGPVTPVGASATRGDRLLTRVPAPLTRAAVVVARFAGMVTRVAYSVTRVAYSVTRVTGPVTRAAALPARVAAPAPRVAGPPPRVRPCVFDDAAVPGGGGFFWLPRREELTRHPPLCHPCMGSLPSTALLQSGLRAAASGIPSGMTKGLAAGGQRWPPGA